MKKRLRLVLTAVLGLSTGVLCHASATGHPHWSKLDFTEQTNQGILRVQMEASVIEGRRILSKLKIWVNGRSLRIPQLPELRLEDPQLHNVDAIYTASISCIDDDCPRASDYPVWLTINFGEKIRRDPDEPKTVTCEYSSLTIDVFALQVGAISVDRCGYASEDRRVIYDPQR